MGWFIHLFIAEACQYVCVWKWLLRLSITHNAQVNSASYPQRDRKWVKAYCRHD